MGCGRRGREEDGGGRRRRRALPSIALHPEWRCLHAQVRGKFSEDGVWYDAVIDSVTPAGKFVVVYEGFGNSEELSLGHIELKNAPRGCPGNTIDPPHADDILWYVLVAECASCVSVTSFVRVGVVLGAPCAASCQTKRCWSG